MTAAAANRAKTNDDWALGQRRRRFGQRLGRYCLGTLLGSGGAASVYMARLDGPHGFERVLALKLVHEHLLADRDFVTMFLDEANLASQLQHPSIVHTYELGQDQDCLYLAMEYLHGQPLSSVYRRALESNRPLPYGLIAWLGARAAEALAHAHAATGKDGEPLHVVHRDVSPDNLFISYDGQLKLLDFGIARAARRLAQTNLGQIKGKLRYMAPEYALGQEFDGGLDIFALGATLYEAALGKPAFEGDEQAVVRSILCGDVQDPRDFRSDFPAGLWHVIRDCLEPDPEARLGPAAKVARELDALAGLSFAQGRALLAITMDRLFDAEKAKAAADLAELRGLRREPDERTEHSHVLNGNAAAPRGKRFGAITLAGLLAAVAAAGLLAVERRPTARDAIEPVVSAPRQTAPELFSTKLVDIAVAVTPPGIAEVAVDIAGVRLPRGEAHRSFARGTAPISVRVTAPGYQAAEVSVVPENDRSVVVTLNPLPTPLAAVPTKPARSDPQKASAANSGVIKRYPF